MSKCFDAIAVKETTNRVRDAMSGQDITGSLKEYNDEMKDIYLPLPSYNTRYRKL